jgi:hypothetical protein
MTDLPDDEPQPGSRAWMEQTAQLDSAMATARRYLSALNAQDHPACNAILVELACDRDGSMVKAFMALAAQALDSPRSRPAGVLDGGSLQEYLDRARNSSTSPRSTRSLDEDPRASGCRRPRLDRADIPHTANWPTSAADGHPFVLDYTCTTGHLGVVPQVASLNYANMRNLWPAQWWYLPGPVGWPRTERKRSTHRSSSGGQVAAHHTQRG